MVWSYNQTATKLKNYFYSSYITNKTNDLHNLFLNSLDHQNGSIYKLNKTVLHKHQPFLPNGPSGLVFVVIDKAKLLADSLQQFITNSGPHISEVSQNSEKLTCLKINNSKIFITPGVIQSIVQNVPKKKTPTVEFCGLSTA